MSDTTTLVPGDGAPADDAASVDAAARAVSGVAELYYAAPLPTRLWRTAVGAGDGPYSSVSRRGGHVEATVSIGVTCGRVPEVAREVATRVRQALGDPDAHVTVRVSRITSAD